MINNNYKALYSPNRSSTMILITLLLVPVGKTVVMLTKSVSIVDRTYFRKYNRNRRKWGSLEIVSLMIINIMNILKCRARLKIYSLQMLWHLLPPLLNRRSYGMGSSLVTSMMLITKGEQMTIYKKYMIWKGMPKYMKKCYRRDPQVSTPLIWTWMHTQVNKCCRRWITLWSR